MDNYQTFSFNSERADISAEEFHDGMCRLIHFPPILLVKELSPGEVEEMSKDYVFDLTQS